MTCRNRSPMVALMALLWCGVSAATAQTIRAVTESTPYTRLRDGKVVGTGADLVEAVLQRAGFTDHRFELYPWARAYDTALKAPNVLLFMIARTPEREHLFKWVGEVSEVRYRAYKLRRRTDIQPTSAQEMAQYSIGVKRDDILQFHYQPASYPKVVVSATDLDTFRKLVGGQVELMPVPGADIQALCRQVQFDCHNLEAVRAFGMPEAVPFGLAFSRQTSDEVVRRTRDALDALRAESALPAVVPQPLLPVE